MVVHNTVNDLNKLTLNACHSELSEESKISPPRSKQRFLSRSAPSK